jgi:CYTH domain-containing protein
MANSIPKYARPEYERRFLVGDIPDLSGAAFRLIDDLYLNDTRLRLRKIVCDDGDTQYKLCKKYPDVGGDPLAIVNVYLTSQEYDVFSALAGKGIRKWRYNIASSALCLDVFEDQLTGLVLCEIEAESAASLEAHTLPHWIGRDVSDDPFFTGGNLASIDAAQLSAKLASLGSCAHALIRRDL